MALSSRVKNRLMDALNTGFDEIGKAIGKMPRSTSNLAPYAWDYFVACHLASRATKRKEQAEAAAVKAGVLIDKEKNPQPEGFRDIVYYDDVGITLEVRRASPRVDTDKLIDYLKAAGVKQSILDEGLRLTTRMTKPAHVFTAYLVTEGTITGK